MKKLIGIWLLLFCFGCSIQDIKESKTYIIVKILTGFSENSNKYISVANKLPETQISSESLSIVGENTGFMLYHSIGHLPHNSEIDVPIVYADYYYLELIIKNKTMEKNN